MTKEEKTKKETKKTKEKQKNNHTILIRFEKDKWHKAIDGAFEVKRKDISVSGFRKGKVPKDVYIKKFGKESLYMDAVDSLINEAYTQALADSKLIPVVKPNLDIKSMDDDHVEFQFVFITKPEVKVKKYKGLKIKKDEVKVTKEEIKQEIDQILERFTELRSKEGKLKKGDIAILDFEGFKDDVAFEGGKAEAYELEIGSNSFIPGFEDALIGLEAGAEKDVELTFPKDYHADDLAGAEVLFKVKLREIKEKVARKFDKDLFEDLAMEGVDSKETLEASVEQSLKTQKDYDAENKYVDTILEEVAKSVEVDIPEGMVDEEADRLLSRFEEQIQMQGINLELYFQLTNSNEEEMKAQFEKEAYKNVLYRLMLEEIAEKEKIVIDKAEVESQAEDLAKRYNVEKEEFLANFGGTEMIEYDLKIRKSIDLLKDLNK